MSDNRTTIAVIGPSTDATDENLRVARSVGALLADAGAVVINGGGSGVMAAAAHGATGRGGTVIGLLPGTDRREGNPYLSVAIPTGLGEIRNALIVRAADAVICIGGSWGTLSEVGFAIRTGVPLVIVDGWTLPSGDYVLAADAQEAVVAALRLASARSQVR